MEKAPSHSAVEHFAVYLPVAIHGAAGRVYHSRFVRQILLLISATSVAQGLLVAAAPVITRLYDPTEFAVYAMFAVVVNLLSAIAAGRYEFAVVLAEDEDEATHIVAIAIALSTVCCIACLVLIVGAKIASDRIGLAPWATWVWLVPGAILTYAWYSISTKWQARKQVFRRIALAEIVASVTALVLQIGGGLLFANATGVLLIAGQLLGRTVALFILSFDVWGHLWRVRSSIGWASLAAAARRYWRFPAFTASGHLIVRGTRELPKVLIAIYFGPAVLGFFALCNRVLGTPMTMVGQAIAHVFFPKISEMRGNPRRCRQLLLAVGISLAVLIGLPTAALLVGGEDIFAVIFGAPWRPAGRYAQILVPLFAAQFIVQPIAMSLQAFEKQNLVLLWQCSFLAGVTGAFLFGRHSPEQALIAYSIIGSAMYALFFAASLYYVESPSVAQKN